MSIVKVVILFCCLTYLSCLQIDSDENSEQRRRINQDEEVPLGPANAMAQNNAHIPPIWIVPFSGNPGNAIIFSPPPLHWLLLINVNVLYKITRSYHHRSGRQKYRLGYLGNKAMKKEDEDDAGFR